MKAEGLGLSCAAVCAGGGRPAREPGKKVARLGLQEDFALLENSSGVEERKMAGVS